MSADGHGQAGQTAIRLIQGYLWHPQELELDFADFLPTSLPGNIHLLWDRLPRAPFTFFDDGTPSNTQAVYQFTVIVRTYEGEAGEDDLAGLLPGLAEQLQELLEDRKSTRLNSSHVAISYAVFC